MKNLTQYNQIIKNENLKKHCSMSVGGNSDYYYEPKTIKDFLKIIKICNKNKINYFILGNGTNTIFTDKGFRGIVICTKKLKKITKKKNIICLDCGVNMYVLNKYLISNGLTGLEWSFGIPGTIGGAVCMNAGAYGGQMKDVVLKVKIFDGKNVKILNSNQLNMTYRDSLIKQKKYIVLKAWLKLDFDEQTNIEQRCKEYMSKRITSQPLEYFNSGSIFKTTNNIIAGKIIDNLGLKGVTINGAQISIKHANFIVNKNNAKCADILELIELIQNKVEQQTGIRLEQEVIIVGER